MQNIFTSLNTYTSYSIENIIKFMFYPNDGFKEHFQIDSITPCESDGTSSAKSYKANPDDIYARALSIPYTENSNIYITKNTLKTEIIPAAERSRIKDTPAGALCSTGSDFSDKDNYVIDRCNANIYSLRNIVIDVDCHESLSEDEFLELKHNFLREYNDMFNVFPKPTLLYFSGRGFHLWYNLEGAYAKKLGWLYKEVTHKMCSVIDSALKERAFSFNGNLSVDYAASENISGLIRLFNTPNPKAVTDGGVYDFTGKRYSLDELKDGFGVVIKKYNKYSDKKVASDTSVSPKKTVKSKKNTKVHKSYVNRVKRVLKALYYAVKRHPDKEGMRDLFCHFFYNFAVQIYSRPEAKRKVYMLNNTFRNPLPEKQILSITDTIDRLKYGHYFYSDESVIRELKLDSKEISIIYDKDKSQREITTDKKRQKKKKRERLILETFGRTGSVTVTARLCKCCKNTVRNIIKRRGKTLEQIKRAYRFNQARLVFFSFIRTQNVYKAAKSGKCSPDFAADIIRRYQTLSHFIDKCLDDGTLVLDEYIFEQKSKHHNKFYKSEYMQIEHVICDTLGLEPEEVNIVMAPYLKIER